MQIELHSSALNQQTLALPCAGWPSGNSVAWLKMVPPTRGVWEMQREVARSRAGEEFAWAGLALGAAGVLAASFWF